MSLLLRPWLAACALALPLAACDPGATEFTTDVAARPAGMLERASHLDFAEARVMAPAIRVEESLPAPDTVQFTLPATSAAGHVENRPTTIRLTFEPIDGGKATRVHASVAVSDAPVFLEGRKELDQGKVVTKLREAIEAMGADTRSNAATNDGRTRLTGMLAAIAMLSNDKQLAAMQADEARLSRREQGREPDMADEPRPGEPTVDLDSR